jgi:hypothetical protein
LGCLPLFRVGLNGCFDPFKPVIIEGLEFGIDGEPTIPFAEPSYRNSIIGMVISSPG